MLIQQFTDKKERNLEKYMQVSRQKVSAYISSLYLQKVKTICRFGQFWENQLNISSDHQNWIKWSVLSKYPVLGDLFQSLCIQFGFPWWLRWLRICLQCRRLRLDPWVGKIPWRRKGMATHSSILAWRISRTGEPGGLQSMASQRAGHNWVTNN